MYLQSRSRLRSKIGQLMTHFAKLSSRRLATLETFDLAAGIERGVPARSHGAHDLARIVSFTVTRPTLHRAVAILDGAPSLLRTENPSVLIDHALPFSADDVSVRIFHAVGG